MVHFSNSHLKIAETNSLKYLSQCQYQTEYRIIEARLDLCALLLHNPQDHLPQGLRVESASVLGIQLIKNFILGQLETATLRQLLLDQICCFHPTQRRVFKELSAPSVVIVVEHLPLREVKLPRQPEPQLVSGRLWKGLYVLK